MGPTGIGRQRVRIELVGPRLLRWWDCVRGKRRVLRERRVVRWNVLWAWKLRLGILLGLWSKTAILLLVLCV
jgi:hypothetical protein